MNKTLFQIENMKSGRRVIYKGFDKWEWSAGNGEDGTFFKEEELDFMLFITGAKHDLYEHGGDCGVIKYDISYFKVEEPKIENPADKEDVDCLF
jgi:hypothetical protein